MVISACRCSPVQDRALEVVEAEFLLQLLMRLLADPARLDRGGKRLRLARAGRFERSICARRSSGARRPARPPRPACIAAPIGHALLGAVGDADAPGGKEAGRRPFVPRRQLILRHFSPAKAASAEIGG